MNKKTIGVNETGKAIAEPTIPKTRTILKIMLTLKKKPSKMIMFNTVQMISLSIESIEAKNILNKIQEITIIVVKQMTIISEETINDDDLMMVNLNNKKKFAFFTVTLFSHFNYLKMT